MDPCFDSSQTMAHPNNVARPSRPTLETLASKARAGPLPRYGTHRGGRARSGQEPHFGYASENRTFRRIDRKSAGQRLMPLATHAPVRPSRAMVTLDYPIVALAQRHNPAASRQLAR